MEHVGVGQLGSVEQLISGGQVGQVTLGHFGQSEQLVGDVDVGHVSQSGQRVGRSVEHVTFGGHVGEGGQVGQETGRGVVTSEQFGHIGHVWGDGNGEQVGHVTGGGQRGARVRQSKGGT